jgi:hypothetical protein
MKVRGPLIQHLHIDEEAEAQRGTLTSPRSHSHSKTAQPRALCPTTLLWLTMITIDAFKNTVFNVVPSPVLSELHMLTHPTSQQPQGRPYAHPHWTKVETEAQSLKRLYKVA